MTFKHNWVHDNDGVGIWFDIDSADISITSNLVENNTATGLNYKSSDGPADISWNVVRDNGAGATGNNGAGIEIANSGGSAGSPIEVHGNAVYDNRFGLFATGAELEYYDVYDNQVKSLNPGYWVQHIVSSDLAADHITAQDNTYFVNAATDTRWLQGPSGAITHHNFAAWQGLGLDTSGATTGHSGTPQLPSGASAPLTVVTHGPVEICDGVSVSTSDNLRAVVAASPAGTTFCLEAGIHYEASAVPKSGMRFLGEPGAVLSGARQLPAGTADQDGNGRWYWTDQAQEGFAYGPLASGGNPRDAYPEELFVNGSTRLTHVDSYANLDAPGEWFFDYSADRIYLYDDPASFSVIETSVEEFAIAPEWWTYPTSADFPDDVVIQNLVIEKYANPAQFGAIGHQANGTNGSDGWIIRHTEVRYTHGCGVRVMNGGTLEYTNIHHHGQIGLCGDAYDDNPPEHTTIRHNRIHHNLELDYSWTWEGGAMKIKQFDGVTFENNWIHDNNGPGIWFDIDNRNIDIVSNLVENNAETGIFYEVSYGPAEIYWNVVRDNGTEPVEPNNFGAGIDIADSEGSATELIEVYGNALYDNRFGIYAHGQGGRANDDGDPIDLAYVSINDNEVKALDPGYWVQQVQVASLATSNITADDNTYFVNAATDTRWLQGPSGSTTHHNFAAWQGLGLDASGTTTSHSGTPQLPSGATPWSYAHTGPQIKGL